MTRDRALRRFELWTLGVFCGLFWFAVVMGVLGVMLGRTEPLVFITDDELRAVGLVPVVVFIHGLWKAAA